MRDTAAEILKTKPKSERKRKYSRQKSLRFCVHPSKRGGAEISYNYQRCLTMHDYYKQQKSENQEKALHLPQGKSGEAQVIVRGLV